MNNENNNVENSSTDNSKALSDLIQSIQAKMEPEEIKSIQEEPKEENNNLNSILSNLDISSLLSAFGNNTSENSNNSNNNHSFSGIDPNLLFKIQKIMSSMSKEDPKKNLLLSLKPFLRKSRQDKINEYISMLTIVNAIEVFSDKGSDKNV
ncbi:MAG: hypothetical protein Q4D02_00870 [Clostridia bacterium]|nr:hypothetical protein [Clostridia bacterium]